MDTEPIQPEHGDLEPLGGAPVPRTALCLSGGGYRAALFHVGALIRLNEVKLLAEVDLVSSVSGGSIAAGFLGLHWNELDVVDGRATKLFEAFVEPLVRACRAPIDVPAMLKGMIPGRSITGEVQKAYDRLLFGEAPLSALPQQPVFKICATNLSSGSAFYFTREGMADWRLPALQRRPLGSTRLSVAVAASSAFPPFLAPLRIPVPPYDADPSAEDWQKRAVLADGGVYDNHGLEPATRYGRILVSDGGAPWRTSGGSFWNWWLLMRRVYDATDNQVRSLRRGELMALYKGRNPDGSRKRLGTYWSIGSEQANYAEKGQSPKGIPFDPLRARQLAALGTRLAPFTEADTRDLVNWGYAIADTALQTWVLSDPPPPASFPL
jgi:NTE family protein